MGESETELCQHTQRERPCRGCQGLERDREGEKGKKGRMLELWVEEMEMNERRLKRNLKKKDKNVNFDVEFGGKYEVYDTRQ